MHRRGAMIVVVLAVLGTVVAVFLWAGVVRGSQAPSGAAATQPPQAVEGWTPPPPRPVPPRTPDGQPNLEGIWSQTGSYTPLERPLQFAGKEFFTEKEAEKWVKNAANNDY